MKGFYFSLLEKSEKRFFETDALLGIADFRQNLAYGDYGEAANILLSQPAQVLLQHFILLIVEFRKS